MTAPDWLHRRDARKADPVIEDNTKRLDLMETGTRWQHYAELRELFACGIEIINRMSLKSCGDAVKLKKLEGAVELLDARLNLLSDFVFLSTRSEERRVGKEC